MTMPGLETVAFGEIRERCSDAELVRNARGVVIFRTEAEPATLLGLRTTEDVYALLARIDHLGRTGDALRVLHSATLHADLTPALALWRHAHHGMRPRTWRVVSQKEGDHDFRRVDAGKAVIDALRKTLPAAIHFSADEAELEVWLWLHGSMALLGVRLSDATMRHRTYKHEHLPASLRPTVAAAMAWLSHPGDDDIIVDPLCGAGTLVIERALMAPCDRAMGGDIRPEAVGVARRNAKAAGITATWRAWDARSLPLEPASVTTILTNLPFGKQIGSAGENVPLYKASKSGISAHTRSRWDDRESYQRRAALGVDTARGGLAGNQKGCHRRAGATGHDCARQAQSLRRISVRDRAGRLATVPRPGGWRPDRRRHSPNLDRGAHTGRIA